MKYSRKRLGLAILLAQSATLTPAAYAQLEEIIVTAERRAASIQDTDISMTALSSESITELGISEYGDIGDFVPNVVTHEQPGNAGTAVMIRGLKNAETLITFEPKVAVYLDGVLIGKNTGSAFDIVDLERVEVLRGPQGTLYGRNTVGGAINLVTKKPYYEFGGNLTVTMGNYDKRDIKGTVNVPLSDTLALKATVASLNRDGYWDNLGPSGPEDVGDQDREAAHVQLQWQPSDAVSLLYGFDSTDADEKAVPRPATFVRDSFIPLIPVLEDVQDFVVTDNDFDVFFNFPQKQELDVKGHHVTADIQINDDLSLTSITAYRESENFAMGDSDGTPFPPEMGWIRHTIQGSEHEMFTQELRLVGSTRNDRLEYVVGAYYLEEEGDLVFSNIRPTVTENTEGSFENDVWAAFGEATYGITESLDLTLGVRYTEEERSMEKAVFEHPPTQFFANATDVPLFAGEVGPETWEDVSGTASLSYHWTTDLMTYAKVSKGFASGGFNMRSSNPAAFSKPFDEETLIAYEVGIKSSWFDNRLVFNAAGFFSDYSDLQVNQFDPETDSNNLANAGDATIKGMEIEVKGQLSDSLEIGGSYGYIDPDYETFIAADGTDLSDSFWAHTPQHSVHTYLRHVLFDAVAGADLVTRVDYMWQDDINFLTFNFLGLGEPNSQKAYDHVNARISLDGIEGLGSGNLSIALWGRNLTDESWRTTGINFVTYASNSWGPPRTWGADLKYSF